MEVASPDDLLSVPTTDAAKGGTNDPTQIIITNKPTRIELMIAAAAKRAEENRAGYCPISTITLKSLTPLPPRQDDTHFIDDAPVVEDDWRWADSVTANFNANKIEDNHKDKGKRLVFTHTKSPDVGWCDRSTDSADAPKIRLKSAFLGDWGC